MKIRDKVHSVERSGIDQENNFSIRATGKAFKILSDGLYSDKIKAIIRELSCNAHDAHVDAKTTNRPFKVHLPNNLEPFFSIRDFGTGLDHKDVMNLYTTYFESTKNNSNDFIGALGLGSKSPFSYVDVFTVSSYFEGTKRQYSAYISESGQPAIALMLEESTQEDNGLEISFPVNMSDFHYFYTKAEQVLSRFKDPKPEIKGYSNFKFIRPEYLLEGDYWRICQDRIHSSSATVIQGNVEYPLDYNIFYGNNSPRNVQRLLNFNIEVDFDIGELDVSASRESLSYDSRTKENIINKFLEVEKDILNQIQLEMNKCKTLWEAKTKFSAYRQLLSYIDLVDLEFKGKKLNDNNIGIKIDDYEQLEFCKFYKAEPLNKNYDARIVNNYKVVRQHPDSYGRILNIFVRNKTKIFFDDLKQGVVSRLRKYDQEGYEIYVIQTPNRTVDKKILDLLGNPPYELTSSLNKNEPKKSNTSVQFFKQTYLDSWTEDDCMTLETLKKNKNKYLYVRIRNRKSIVFSHYFKNFVSELKERKILKDDIKIVGVRYKDLKKVEKAGVRKFNDYIKTRLSRKFNKDLQTKYFVSFLLDGNRYDFANILDNPEIEKVCNNINNRSSKFLKYKKSWDELNLQSLDHKDFSFWKRAIRFLITDENLPKFKQIEQECEKFCENKRIKFEQIFEDYPVLKYIELGTWHDKQGRTKAAIEYINLVDRVS